MQFGLETSSLLALTTAMQDSVTYGVNANTATTDERAWDLWEHICREHDTSPLRTTREAREHPERNSHLLAVLLLHAFSIGKPKSKARSFIKPSSALAYPLAIVRVFGRWGITMASYKLLKAHVAGLCELYREYHGPMTLAPTRAEPMKFSMVRTMNNIKTGTVVGTVTWSDTNHDVFTFKRLSRTMMVTALRLGEICQHRSKGIRFLTFASLSWRVNSRIITLPTRENILSLRFLRDNGFLQVPLSKPDQNGEIHCPFPIILTYEDVDINAAAGLADLELKIGVHLSEEERKTTPLFGDAHGKPYVHSYLHQFLRMVLTHLYGEKVASVYSFHSYRSGLATALHAAGVDDPMVMLICRWMCPESLHIYRRMGIEEHETNIRKASGASVDSIQSGNVPRVAACEGLAALLRDMEATQTSKGLEKQFDEAAELPQERNKRKQPASKPQLPSPPPTAPTQPPALTPATPTATPVGTRIVIAAAAWPSYTCNELSGAGWRAEIKRSAAAVCKVKFLDARTRDGRPYEDAMVPWRFVYTIRE